MHKKYSKRVRAKTMVKMNKNKVLNECKFNKITKLFDFMVDENTKMLLRCAQQGKRLHRKHSKSFIVRRSDESDLV